MSEFFPTSTGITQADVKEVVGETMASQIAMPIPAYLIADLPLASMYPNCLIRVIDNPQGQASSNGTTWISEVDGTDLGPGHGD